MEAFSKDDMPLTICARSDDMVPLAKYFVIIVVSMYTRLYTIGPKDRDPNQIPS